MNIFSKTSMLFALACSIAPMHAMNENNQQITINATLEIIDQYPALYGNTQYHKMLSLNYGTNSTINDPILPGLISFEDSMYHEIVPVPAKNLIFCNNGSKIQLHDNRNQTPMVINALCKKNERLAGKDFSEQYSNEMQKFFSQPIFSENSEKNKKELENAGIVVKQETTVRAGIYNTIIKQIIWFDLPQVQWEHGTNGCSSKERIIESILNEKIAQDQSAFHALRTRELNGSFKKYTHSK
jgi:hypothetical protein